MHIDCFSIGLDDIPKKEINAVNIIKVLAKTGKFSCFEAGANDKIAGAMTSIMKSPFVESYTPDFLKGKPEIGGTTSPDRDGYPWVYVRITPTGYKYAGLSTPTNKE